MTTSAPYIKLILPLHSSLVNMNAVESIMMQNLKLPSSKRSSGSSASAPPTHSLHTTSTNGLQYLAGCTAATLV